MKNVLNKQSIFPSNEQAENPRYPQLLAAGTSGAYTLVIQLKQRCDLSVGRLGIHPYPAGYYIYLGRALGPGGVRARVRRHLRCTTMKPVHWHVDRLLAVGEIVEVWWKYGKERVECLWSARLNKIGSIHVPRFGASDCRCPGHLVRFEDRNRVSSAYQLLESDLHLYETVEARPFAPPG